MWLTSRKVSNSPSPFFAVVFVVKIEIPFIQKHTMPHYFHEILIKSQ